MKSGNASILSALKTSHNVEARPRLTVEWNLNRYNGVTANNIPVEDLYGYDAEVFPVESITSSNRPTKGIAKGRVGEMTLAETNPLKQKVRFYLGGADDIYKYWCSPVETNGSGTFPLFNSAFIASYEETGSSDGLTTARPHILYDTVVKANKIVVKTENSWATPSSYSVSYRATVGGAWVAIPGSSAGLNLGTGQLTLWWNGTAWTTTRPTGILLTTNIAGIMFTVNSMTAGRDSDGNVTTYNKNGITFNTTGANSFLNVIEIAACLEADMTSKLISVNDTFDMADSSLTQPMGTITANVANVVLSDIYNDLEYSLGSSTEDKPGLFDANNTASPFSNLAEQNAVFNLEHVYTINGLTYPVQEFNMYSGPWTLSEESTISVSLRDYSKFFDEVKPLPLFWINRNVSEIIWRLCDHVGFTNYEVGVDDIDNQPNIPYFWTDGEMTLWQILDEISKATQTAIYFDADGVLQIKSRRAALDKNRISSWTLRGESGGGELANIVSISGQSEVQSNHVKVVYYTANTSEWNNSSPHLKTVWEPESNQLLRGTVLAQSLVNTSTHVSVSQEAARTWPYQGIVQIEGELIRIEGKQFAYREGGVLKYANVKSAEEKDKFNQKTSETQRYQNDFTGKLKISERGIWNSEQKNHQVEALGYNVRKIEGGLRTSLTNGFKHDPKNSVVRMTSTSGRAIGDLLVATRGAEVDSTFFYYGTRLRFKKTGRAHQRAGLLFNNSATTEDGYFVELTESSKIDRTKEKELSLYTKVGGTKTRIGKRSVPVLQEKWYDIDITFQILGNGDHRIQVAMYGWVVIDTTISTGKNAANGKFGMFLHGDSDAEFEYLYGIRQPQGETIDETTFFDYIDGGYMGRQWDVEWVYRWKKTNRRERKNTGRKKKRFNRMLMDEFGPWVHEVREYDVKFEPSPVLHTKFMVTSPSAVCTEFISTAFGAKFILANTARRDVVVHGDDSLANPGSGTDLKSIMMILGRTVDVMDAQEVIRTNDAQVKIKGKIETEINSKWIQSETAATELADWINEHWSAGNDELSVTIFGNPFIEISDIVSISYAEKFMTPATHKYYVIGTSSDFANGIQTTLTLRRVT